LPSTFEAIGNKLGKYVKTSEEILKGIYTSYSRISIEMDVSGALLEACWGSEMSYSHPPFPSSFFTFHHPINLS
jgi:hypothetical protein